MYKKNPLYRNVLITVDEVLFHAPTKHTVDPRTIQQSIIVAEERLISPALGFDFYEQLTGSKNVVVNDGNKVDLQTKINANIPTGGQAIVLTNGDIVNAMEILSANNLALWKQHLWKLTAECVMLLATPEAFVQFTSEGVVHTNPQAGPMTASNITSPELRTVKWTMDKKLMDRIDPLMEAMHVWLCKKKSLYPLYTKACDCDVNGTAYKRKSDLVTGLYDEEDDCNCGCL